MENKSIKISVRIIALFTAAILISLIPEHFHSFFGDWYCEGAKLGKPDEFGFEHIEGCLYLPSRHNAEWHWGYQHWLFFLMGLSLTIVQIFDITKLIKQNGKDK